MSAKQQRLQQLYSQLPKIQQAALLEFAEFLHQRHADPEPAVPLTEPAAIPRPADESVVAAIKRLRESYTMLDHGKLLHEASALMAKHLVQGEPAEQVIDELEALFERRYKRLQQEQE